ncbi:Brp/Blh family beta-carotene 15,15'-dioxygenase [Hymenobacter sp. NST-14]|uniref:Brp/Blh family beta-carotene 15,15'-dioxygenase n=1 Tax=Hymenobacter piscis TaxID=2839984 RepID=UPI001C026A4B|nr:Brp/Blh family beta-carotene 15,15'-dioxygenase [Hymenobacter piscis]MBT9392585.1 Brp/Blh family beta-carotene 15,15'-dioxygenase [Hymenobacter piscis]
MSLFFAGLSTFRTSRRRYSYLAILAATALGLAFPNQADRLLALPLVVGMVGLGVAHGACDQWVVPAAVPSSGLMGSWHYWLRFLVGYLGLAALVGVLWWGWPALTVGLFFLLTVWHWGSADAPATPRVSAGGWLVHSLLRGLLLFAVPAWWWPVQTSNIVNDLLVFAGSSALRPAAFSVAAQSLGAVVLAGHLGLWAVYGRQGRVGVVLTDLLETTLLLGLLVVLPPRLSVGVYFVFWHSLQHVLRLNHWLGRSGAPGKPRLLAELTFFLRRAAPLLALSCLALLLMGWWLAAEQRPSAAAWFSFALVVASIVTMPHALLVTLVMDARHWRMLRRPAPGQHP